jgi:hypothetical protein
MEYVGEEIGVDIVGDHYGVEGYGDEVGLADIVGEAVKKAVAQVQQQRGRQAPPRMAGLVGAQRVVRDTNTIARRQMSPMPLTTVAAGATATVSFRPQRPIRAERLVLDGASIAGVFVTDFLIGADPQFVNSGAVPVSVFTPSGFNMELRGNTAQPGIDVTLTFQNTTGAAVTLGGMLLGTSLT